MRRSIFLPAAALFATLGLAGCDNVYSDAVKYGVRKDPLVKDKNLGDEQIPPDRPGVLPLLSSKDLQNPENPLYKNRNVLFKERKLYDPTLITAEDRAKIERKLEYLFGSPARPLVRLGNTDILEALKIQEKDAEEHRPLENGANLFRIHCLHCHGVTGDGRGPTARWVNPHPRDYRQGRFKFMSVDQTKGPKMPRREDLLRVLHQGLEGTAMPSFALLPTSELEDMVSYVIHLSMRGKVEYDTIVNTFTFDVTKNRLTMDEDANLDEQMDTYLDIVSKDWFESQKSQNLIKVGDYPYTEKDLDDSIRRGYRLFIGEGEDKPGPAFVTKKEADAAKCASCHKDFGRQSLYKFDDWGTLTKPRDLTRGVFRGGSRPVDIYYRIHSGISGSGMNSFGDNLKSERIWDLVNFVKALPYPAMRKSTGIVID